MASIEKSVHASAWQGSLKIVDVARARNLAWMHVAEARVRGMLKWWTSIAAFSLGNPVLYLFSVGIGIGALVDANGGSTQLGGVSYLTFLAPALLASAALASFQEEMSFPIMEGFEWDKSFFAMNSTPINGSDIVNGIVAASFLKAAVTVGIYEAVLLAFGAIDLSVALPMYFSALITGISFGAVMMAVTSYIKNDDGFFAIIGRFVIAPMVMFSGTYYPLESMPIYLQWVGWISPLWHGTDLGRVISYGSPQQGWIVISHWLYLATWLVVGLTLAYRQVSKRLAA
jgi:lipooligosaccharide transport system permease protein